MSAEYGYSDVVPNGATANVFHSKVLKEAYGDIGCSENSCGGSAALFFNRASTKKMLAHVGSDIAAFNLAVFFAYCLSFLIKQHINPEYPHPSLVQVIQFYPVMFLLPLFVLLVACQRKGHYSQFKSAWAEWGEFCVVAFSMLGFTIACLYLFRVEFSRSWLLASWATALGLVPLCRELTKNFLRRKGVWYSPTLVIGSGDNAVNAALAIESDVNFGFRVSSLVDLSGLSKLNQVAKGHDDETVTAHDPIKLTSRKYRVVRTRAGLDELLDVDKSHYIVLAFESGEFKQHENLINQILLSRKNISVIPPLKGVPLSTTQVSPIFRHEALHLKVTTNLFSWSARALKRMFDIAVSLSLLIILFPLFLLLGLMIKADGGSALYSQQRIGRSGKLFSCWKFRSMCANSDFVLQRLLATDSALNEEYSRTEKLKNDPRITRVGAFIRKFSIDELPQLFNVFVGQMSLVGPRPVRQDELFEKYGKHSSFYLATAPGITGLWQISGRNELDYRTRVDLDTWYVRNWSMWGDLQILVKTLSVVLKSDGAY